MQRDSTSPSDALAFLTGTILTISLLFFSASTTNAATCGLGSNVTFSSISGGRCQAVITGGTSFTVPRDWNSSNNTIEVVGPGGKGADRNSIVSSAGGGGGGGGAYAAITNLSLTRGSSVSYSIGIANSGNATYFNGPNSAAASVAAAAGASGGTVTTGLAGGLASNSIGTTKFNGGSGASQSAGTGGGGGGAAGPNGAGGTPASGGTGGTGDNGSGGAGGTTTSTDGNPGSSGTEWTTAGSGGGGAGGAPSGGWNGGNGGNYGAGGGGAGGGNAVDPGGLGGSGVSGVIVITYTPGTVSLTKPVNNLGLIGYWPFNEATSTQAGDFSGNGNTGTITGATWTTGIRGSALSFAGGTNNVNIGTFTALNGQSTATISFWINDPSPTASRSIFSAYQGASPAMVLQISDPGNGGANNIQFQPDNGNLAYTTTGNHRANRWEHWVIVYDGTQADANKVTFYENGVLQTSTINSTPIGTTINTVSHAIHIGADSDNAGAFTGKLDDMRVYSRALSASEVAALYAGGTAGATRVNGSSKVLQQGTTLGNGLVGHWTFDGGDVRWNGPSAGVAYDASGNNNIGTLTSMTQAGSVVAGKLGQAFNFDGSASYVSIASAASLGNAVFTISAWANLPDVTAASYQTIFERNRGGTSDSGIWKSANGSFFSCEADNGAGHDFATTISPNTWYHVVCTHDANGTTVLYLNGVQDGSFADAVGTTQSGTASIGANPTPGEFFPGKIDDVRVYNRALTAAEVKKLFLLGTAKIKP